MKDGRRLWLISMGKTDFDSVDIRKMLFTSNQEFFQYSNSITDSRALTFFCIEDWRDLSFLLKITPLQLEQIINYPTYIQFNVPKKKGKPRLISQPNSELMIVQRRLNLFLQAVYYRHIPSCVHGFVPKSNEVCRSIVSNAHPHVGKKNILTIDLKDYFSTISVKRVKNLFKSWCLNDEVSKALALLCTFRGVLPMGAPTSPILANLCSYDMDLDLKLFCEKNEITYSRYADDLTFSSNEKISEELIFSLTQIIDMYGFSINNKKTRISGNHRKQKITGIIVNQKLSVERKLKKKIRAIEHDIKINGVARAAERHFKLIEPANSEMQSRFLNKIQGLKSFVRFVETN
jgi:RNA-directed DNA polymerase